MRISRAGSGPTFAALCTERDFESGFHADHSSPEIFSVQLLQRLPTPFIPDPFHPHHP